MDGWMDGDESLPSPSSSDGREEGGGGGGGGGHVWQSDYLGDW